MTQPDQPDQDGPQYDVGRVVDHLEQQLGRALGQAARLEAVIATLLDERNTLMRERDEALAAVTKAAP